jgi:hypothetical protein
MEAVMKIILNGAKCLKCGDVIYSRNRHDFKYCQCKAIAVDGGLDYIRRLGESTDMQDASAYASETDKGRECAGMFLIYSPQGTNNPQTVFCRREEALVTAGDMKKKFGGAWYISGPLESV